MANTIKQKRGTTDPGASDLVVGELAINTTDGGVFTKTDGGTVVEVGAGGASEINDLSDGVSNSSGQTVGLGSFALNSDDGTTNKNTATGYIALYNTTTGAENNGFGNSALYANTTGSRNDAFGYRALYSNTVGSLNTAVGNNALRNSTGSGNTAVGYQAGNGITTGQNNLCLGYDADVSSATVSNEITLGNSSISTLRCNTQTISSLSDARDKTDVQELPEGLDFISKLNPVKFQWQTRDGNGKDGTYEAGFIAQELQSAQKDADADYLGLVMDENPDRLEASYGKLVPMLVKAIQELKSEVEQLKANV